MPWELASQRSELGALSPARHLRRQRDFSPELAAPLVSTVAPRQNIRPSASIHPFTATTCPALVASQEGLASWAPHHVLFKKMKDGTPLPIWASPRSHFVFLWVKTHTRLYPGHPRLLSPENEEAE
jgi:hypothetical protein